MASAIVPEPLTECAMMAWMAMPLTLKVVPPWAVHAVSAMFWIARSRSAFVGRGETDLRGKYVEKKEFHVIQVFSSLN